MVLRVEDLDPSRCCPEYRDAVYEDLRWFGLIWDEGPFLQSERRAYYLAAWVELRGRGLIYPCSCSRRDVLSATAAPHAEDEEPIYPGTCRSACPTISGAENPAGSTWRFRVPDGKSLEFVDCSAGSIAQQGYAVQLREAILATL
jgi:glutamyl-tRNA synthetase